jgi:hypothetical protein
MGSSRDPGGKWGKLRESRTILRFRSAVSDTVVKQRKFVDVNEHPHSRGANRARAVSNIVPPKKRGRREGRVPNAPAASRAKVESTRVSHYRFTGVTRPFLRNGLRLIACSPRCPGLLATVACASYRRLDPSVARSGPHDFAVRFSATRQRHLHVHCIPPHVS